MRFFLSNSISNLNSVILTKDDSTILELNNNNYIKYLGIYYVDKNKTKTYFIGKYTSYKSIYTYQNEIIGVYILPLYIYLENEWYKIINYQNLINENKQILYPHLISIYNFYSEYNSLPYAHTIELYSNLNEITGLDEDNLQLSCKEISLN
jgi:hypothetical protein